MIIDWNDRASYLTIAEAAGRLGVSSSTLRNWHRDLKLIPVMHPTNGYRVYTSAQLQNFQDQRRQKGHQLQQEAPAPERISAKDIVI